MRYFHIIFVLVLCMVLLSCANNIAKNDYSAFYTNPPRSILIVPILNETVDIMAPNILSTTVSKPLGDRGYYVFPIYLTDLLLKDLGLTEAGLAHQLPPQAFHKHFGADAVLFITIKDWSSKFIMLQNTVVVRAHYSLVDTRSGNILWEHTQELTKSSGGNGLAEMIASAIVDKIVTEIIESEYYPLAKNMNILAFTQNGTGLPAGPYHPQYGLDRSVFPVIQP